MGVEEVEGEKWGTLQLIVTHEKCEEDSAAA